MHFSLLVVGEEPEQQLARFTSMEATGPDDAQMDWWQIGGRWTGFFITHGHQEADSARTGDVDWAAMRARSGEAGDRGIVFTFAILQENRWLEADSFDVDVDIWPARWWSIVSALPADALLTIVDGHT